MSKRYCKRAGQSDEDDETLIHRPTTFGGSIEADHMFPSQEARGLSDEQSALVVRDRFSGAVMVYLQNERNEQANFESLRHFAGRYLSGKKGVLFVSGNPKEPNRAASRRGWIPDPSVPGFWPHNSSCEREVRTLKELATVSHGRRFHQVSIRSFGRCRLTFLPKPGHSLACVQ